MFFRKIDTQKTAKARYLNHKQTTNCSQEPVPRLSFLETVFLPFIKQVGFGASQVNNLGTPVSIFLLLSALLAVIGIGDTEASADDAPPLEGAVVTLVANPDKRTWAHI